MLSGLAVTVCIHPSAVLHYITGSALWACIQHCPKRQCFQDDSAWPSGILCWCTGDCKRTGLTLKTSTVFTRKVFHGIQLCLIGLLITSFGMALLFAEWRVVSLRTAFHGLFFCITTLNSMGSDVFELMWFSLSVMVNSRHAPECLAWLVAWSSCNSCVETQVMREGTTLHV